MKYFTKDHEWVELNGSVATIGIASLPHDGANVRAGLEGDV